MHNYGCIQGNLTRDPEVRKTNDGVTVVNFQLASTRNYKNRDGNYDADFIPCFAFRNVAERIAKYCKKGSQIIVEGSLESSRYTDNDGNNRTRLQLSVDDFNFSGGRNEGGASDSSSNESRSRSDDRGYNRNASRNNGGDRPQRNDRSDDDDLPF